MNETLLLGWLMLVAMLVVLMCGVLMFELVGRRPETSYISGGLWVGFGGARGALASHDTIWHIVREAVSAGAFESVGWRSASHGGVLSWRDNR
jgi:hypothetical protein